MSKPQLYDIEMKGIKPEHEPTNWETTTSRIDDCDLDKEQADSLWHNLHNSGFSTLKFRIVKSDTKEVVRSD